MIETDRRAMLKAMVAGASAAAAAPLVAAKPGTSRAIRVIGHRGACALRPEHTLASYAKAIADGADYIEPDLMPSRDGVLMALHEPDLGKVTDVAAHPEFADRRKAVTIGGHRLEGWFITDFTFAELKTLRLKERIPDIRPGNTRYDGMFQMVSFDEIVDFVAAEATARGYPIGIAPELKAPTIFASVGLPVEDRFVAAVAAHRYLAQAPLIVQCFEIATLKRMRAHFARGGSVQLMQLIDDAPMIPLDVASAGGTTRYADMMTGEGLKRVADYADIVAPDIRALIPLRPDGRLGDPSPSIGWAKSAGLIVGGYEFRPENRFLAANFRDRAGPDARNPGGSIAEIHAYLRAGMDQFFTDDPGIGRRAVDTYRGGRA
ncbi:glycerophosphodiester phosphodiesterase family protein [Sphingomonadaceae bacterium jetA1]|jgi:glycerophosphoryl diester phosphodiesterase|uniref:glycerophosphodiester phosphodiesterase family protein n=1 Tax=Facivitalis istanbulensis TaxID=3075838 RepID=UPI0034836C04